MAELNAEVWPTGTMEGWRNNRDRLLATIESRDQRIKEAEELLKLAWDIFNGALIYPGHQEKLSREIGTFLDGMRANKEKLK